MVAEVATGWTEKIVSEVTVVGRIWRSLRVCLDMFLTLKVSSTVPLVRYVSKTISDGSTTKHVSGTSIDKTFGASDLLEIVVWSLPIFGALTDGKDELECLWVRSKNGGFGAIESTVLCKSFETAV